MPVVAFLTVIPMNCHNATVLSLGFKLLEKVASYSNVYIAF